MPRKPTMLEDFPSGHRINPERFLERPLQNTPPARITYGAHQNIEKPLECAKIALVGQLRTVGYAAQVPKSVLSCNTFARNPSKIALHIGQALTTHCSKTTLRL